MTLLKDNLDGWKGYAALYSMDKPIAPACAMMKAGLCNLCVTDPPKQIIISSVEKAVASDHGGPEVKAFRATPDGEAECMATFAEIVGSQSHDELLQKMGLTWKQ